MWYALYKGAFILNKNNFIYDILKKANDKKRYILSTSAGLFNGQVEFPYLGTYDQDYGSYDLIVLKNGYLQQGKDKINLDDTYVFLDSIISISPAIAEN